MDKQKVMQIGNAAMDRRRFLRNAAITAGAVPVIMTLTAPGALAAHCSGTNRAALCNCSGTGQGDCATGMVCVAGTVCTPDSPCCCVATGAQPGGNHCTNDGLAGQCCSGQCRTANGQRQYCA